MSWYASGSLDTGTRVLPVAFEGRLFVPRNFAALMPMRLVVIGHGNHGSVDDGGWYVKQLETNGPIGDSVFVVPALTHGSASGLPDGGPGASEENAWRMLIGIAAALVVPGVVDIDRICGFGYSLGAASSVAMMCLAGQYPDFSRIRGGASLGVGVYDGAYSWPQSAQVAGLRAPQFVLNGELDQYINHAQGAALVNSVISRNIPGLLIEYPGVDHFTLPTLSEAWSAAAIVLKVLTEK